MNSAVEYPPALLKSGVIDGRPLNKILLELVVYPKNMTVAQFDWVLNLYASVCPRDRIRLFQIPESQTWSRVATPYLTQSARAAQAEGRRYAYFEAARRRIQEHRPMEAKLWDGCEIEDEAGSCALGIRGLKYKSQETHWYIRFLFPLSFQPDQLIGPRAHHCGSYRSLFRPRRSGLRLLSGQQAPGIHRDLCQGAALLGRRH